MKPILTISDFSRGIVDDQTASVTDGFSEIYGMDIKTVPGILQAQYNIPAPSGSIQEICSVAPFKFDPRSTGYFRAFGVRANVAAASIFSHDGSAWSTLRSITAPSTYVAFPETVVFQNHLMYPYGTDSIGSMLAYAQGTLSVTNLSGAVTLSGGAWTADMGNGGSVASTIYIDNGSGTYIGYTFSYSTPTTGNLTPSYTETTGTGRKYYILAFNDSGIGTGPTSLALTNKTARYRPMAEKDNQLYVGDGAYVHRYNPGLATFTRALDLGSDYTVKKILRSGEWLYLLADRNSDGLASSGGTKSWLFVWDGSSEAVARAVPFDCVCWSILAAENVIWCATEARGALGSAGDIALRYFNGSDFPLAKHVVLNKYGELNSWGHMYPNALAAYNGALYLGIRDNTSSYPRDGVWEFSNFDNEGKALVFRQHFVNPTCVWVVPGEQGTDLLAVESAQGSSISARGGGNRLASDVDGTLPYVLTNSYFVAGDQFPVKIKAVSVDTMEPLPTGTSVNVQIARDGGSLFGSYADITPSNQDLPCYFDPIMCQSIRVKLTFTINGGATPRIKNIRLY